MRFLHHSAEQGNIQGEDECFLQYYQLWLVISLNFCALVDEIFTHDSAASGFVIYVTRF